MVVDGSRQPVLFVGALALSTCMLTGCGESKGDGHGWLDREGGSWSRSIEFSLPFHCVATFLRRDAGDIISTTRWEQPFAPSRAARSDGRPHPAWSTVQAGRSMGSSCVPRIPWDGHRHAG
ncbi:hypothetical protein EV126DRAFT_119071 [Verticillium dahliae]|nr:hypothetical protein EV126DRAFT_119071 [Verticillium dahliae]